jgi:flagellin
LNGTEPTLEIQVGIKNNEFEDRFKFDTSSLVTTINELGLTGVNTIDKASSQNNLEMLDGAITKVNENRATLGALQNRLMSTINNISIYNENLSAANSRIRDTDMAEETSELVKRNILTQSNISVLGQANANPQAVLKLLS